MSGSSFPKARVIPLAAAFFLLGVCLRGPFGGTSALLDVIGDDLGLGVGARGALTTVTVACMALAAPFGPALGRRCGAEVALTGLLGVLVGGLALRELAFAAPVLFVSVVVVGIAMGVGSTLVPAAVVARVDLRWYGLVTGLHATGMSLGVAAAALLAVDLLGRGADWRSALAAWALVTAGAALVWVLVMSGGGRTVGVEATEAGGPEVRRSRRVTFVVTVYAGTPMAVGFSVLAWLPSYLVAAGASLSTATLALVCFQVIQVVSMPILPVVVDRVRRGVLAWILLLVPPSAVVLALGLLVTAPLGAGVVGATLLGFGVGGGTATGLSLLARVAGSVREAARLGAHVFAVAFVAGALLPSVVGLLVAVTGSFQLGFVAVAVLAAAAWVVVATAGRTLLPEAEVSKIVN